MSKMGACTRSDQQLEVDGTARDGTTTHSEWKRFEKSRKVLPSVAAAKYAYSSLRKIRQAFMVL